MKPITRNIIVSTLLLLMLQQLLGPGLHHITSHHKQRKSFATANRVEAANDDAACPICGKYLNDNHSFEPAETRLFVARPHAVPALDVPATVNVCNTHQLSEKLRGPPILLI